MEDGLVAIDKFGGGSQAYFLTHLHYDHTRGLACGGASGWRHGPLYCSPVTARLLPTRFPGLDTSLVRPLEPGATAALALTSPASREPVHVLVTAIDAVHCPGSLMYLFRGDFGCVLYTGDFRWELNSEKARAAKRSLLDALNGDKVDILYVDNTYCHPSFCFPPREVVAEQVVDIIRAHPHHEVIVGVNTLGKEDLLLHISKSLETKIWVWPQRLQTMHLLGIDDNREIFTTRTCLTRVRAVPRYSLTIETLEALNTVCPTIGIMPSGLPWLLRNGGGNTKSPGRSSVVSMKCKGHVEGAIEMDYDPMDPPKLFDKDAYTLPYSEHSCFAEIEDFMQTVQPSTVIGIVSSSFCYVNPRHHFSHLCGGNEYSDKTPERNSDRDAENLKPKKRPNGLPARKARQVRISSSSVYRSRVTMKRKARCGARIEEPEELVSVL